MITIASTLTMLQPRSASVAHARRSSSKLDAPASAGSSDGYSSPMSAPPAAPSSASVTAWLIRSASECPASPRADGISTPASTSRRPSANACASKPIPTRSRSDIEHLLPPFPAFEHRQRPVARRVQLRQSPREVAAHPLRSVRVRPQRDRHAPRVQHRQQLRIGVELVERLVVPGRGHLGTDPGHRIPIPDRRQLPVHRQPGHPVHRAQPVVPVIPPDHLADLLLAPAQVVDLERDLHRQAGIPRLRDCAVVATQVAHRICLPERVVEPVARLGVAVDVVGEADLVDPSCSRRRRVAADVLEREAVIVVRHVVVDQVHVVVGQHRRRASARSSGVVTLRLAGSPSTTATRPPAASTSDAQSVAAASTSVGCAWARRSTSARNPWGVCTATSWERSGVSTTNPALTRLTGSVTGTPGTAPSAWPSASSTRDTSS